MTTGAGVLGLGREHAINTVKMHYCFEKLLQNKTNWVYRNDDQESFTKTVNIMAPGIGFFGKCPANIVHKEENILFFT